MIFGLFVANAANTGRKRMKCCSTAGILDELDPSERKLFSDNIRRLDKRIHQGMTKLTWSSKGTSLYAAGRFSLGNRRCVLGF